MTTALDARLIPKVFALVEKYGKVLTFTEDSGTYSPAAGSRSETLTTEDHKVTPPSNYSEKMVDGTSIRRGDVQVFLPTHKFTLDIDKISSVTFKKETTIWELVNYFPIYTGEDLALYELQLRS